MPTIVQHDIPTTIPDHDVSDCKNIDSRLDIFDFINEQNILRGGYDIVRKRMENYGQSDLLAREYDYYQRREVCNMCFWKLIWDNLPLSVMNKTKKTKLGLRYLEVHCNKEEMLDHDSIQRFVKQDSYPITEYAYCTSDLKDGRCKFQIIYKTEDKKMVQTRVVERCFPEHSVIKMHYEYTGSEKIEEILDTDSCVKKGHW